MHCVKGRGVILPVTNQEIIKMIKSRTVCFSTEGSKRWILLISEEFTDRLQPHVVRKCRLSEFCITNLATLSMVSFLSSIGLYWSN